MLRQCATECVCSNHVSGSLGTMLGGYQVLLGGYQARDSHFVEKTFTNLPSHHVLRIKAIFTRVDALEVGKMLVDGIDGAPLPSLRCPLQARSWLLTTRASISHCFAAWRRSFSYLEGPNQHGDSPLGATSACGQDWHGLYNEVQVHIDVTTFHTGQTATVRFEAVGSDRGGYFGVQSLQILSAQSHPSPPSPPSPPGVWQGIIHEDRFPGASGWNASNLGISNCVGLQVPTMLGGYQLLQGSYQARTSDFAEKTFYNLPHHQVLRVKAIYTRVDALSVGQMWIGRCRGDRIHVHGPPSQGPPSPAHNLSSACRRSGDLASLFQLFGGPFCRRTDGRSECMRRELSWCVAPSESSQPLTDSRTLPRSLVLRLLNQMSRPVTYPRRLVQRGSSEHRRHSFALE